MVIATAVIWPLYTYLLVSNGLEYPQTLVFMLVIAALVQMLETAFGSSVGFLVAVSFLGLNGVVDRLAG